MTPESRVTVFGADEQSDEPIELRRWTALAQQILIAEGVRRLSEVSLLFVDEKTITELNERHMGESGPTDVLAFPIDDDPTERGRWPDSSSSGPDRHDPDFDDLPLLLGDVVVCPTVARRQAPDHAGTYDDEVALLVVHGVLHVLGMDHAEDEDAAAMKAKEREYLERFHHAGS